MIFFASSSDISMLNFSSIIIIISNISNESALKFSKNKELLFIFFLSIPNCSEIIYIILLFISFIIIFLNIYYILYTINT